MYLLFLFHLQRHLTPFLCCKFPRFVDYFLGKGQRGYLAKAHLEIEGMALWNEMSSLLERRSTLPTLIHGVGCALLVTFHLFGTSQGAGTLNLSGCKGISDKSLQMVGDNYQHLDLLYITSNLRFLDLCVAQNISDEGHFSKAKCNNIRILNLTC
ncbi:unnamed protein product [Lactuca virosa]|uniref:Uncharacterized protein n=1 Tax=Lactuca virosa TaxID=75947 RepID=A0AAU9MEZ5_9ASTR|nr:unnamed protein product [Lactuca virosa]